MMPWGARTGLTEHAGSPARYAHYAPYGCRDVLVRLTGTVIGNQRAVRLFTTKRFNEIIIAAAVLARDHGGSSNQHGRDPNLDCGRGDADQEKELHE
jgi:hypothetical protein